MAKRFEHLLQSFSVLIKRAKAASKKKRFFVCIEGGICSGKTSFAKQLLEELSASGEATVLIQVDDYLKPRKVREEQQLKHDGWVKLELFDEHLQQLVAGAKKVVKPTYSLETGLVGGQQELCVPENALVLVEGVYTLREKIRGSFDLKIALNANAEVRLQRWSERCLRLAGLPFEHTRNRFYNFTEPVYTSYLERVRNSADIQIDTSDFNNLKILPAKPELLEQLKQ